ncbi:hypothetical protein ACH4VT_36470 [Streptomyces lydicus]|uniref:hypothetical protein n=1 Tax=Streptomyces lydicus TaxID=47763 RepID=UPI003787472D
MRRARAGQVVVRLAAPDEIFADYPVRGQTRIKVMTAPPAPPAGVTYRPMTAAEYPAWPAAGEQRYLADMVRAGSHTPEQARKKAEEGSAMAIGEQVTRDIGDRVVMFNVFGGNEVAMSLYTAVGYRVLEETRSRGLAAGVDG